MQHPSTQLDGVAEGAISEDGQLMATYCHGLFDQPDALNALLEWAGHKPSARFDPNERRERDLDRLADTVEQHMDMAKLAEWLPMLENNAKETQE